MAQVEEFISSNEIIEIAKKVISIEATQISLIKFNINEEFVNSINVILQCKGKLIVSGIGKSGLIGQKISATLSSYGTQSFFLHPAEAYHGDLGMIDPNDVLLLLSYSGETDEVLRIIPFLQAQGNIIISMTGDNKSNLARNANYNLDVSIQEEACPFNLAPTSSTTACLVMGDALAVTLMEAKGFKVEEFARLHPGGNLGRKLLSKVEHEMIRGVNLPLIGPEANAIDTIHAISDGRLGAVVVVDDSKKLLGIITDGDIRRSTLEEKENFLSLKAHQFMTSNPHTVKPNLRIYDAEKKMDSLKIHQLVVIDDNKYVLGFLPYRSQINNYIHNNK